MARRLDKSWPIALSATLAAALLFGGELLSARVEATPDGDDPGFGSVQLSVRLLKNGTIEPGSDAGLWLPDLPNLTPLAVNPEIAQRFKRFQRVTTVIPTGSTVDFPNYDRVYHNVFSLSPANRFDLGLYRKGKSKSVIFDKNGLVRVYCNIHPDMVSYLHIVDSEHFGVTDAGGRLSLEHIPAGLWRLKAWHPQGGESDIEIEIRAGEQTVASIDFDVSDWSWDQHTNKHGKKYPPPDDEDFRY